MIFARVVGNVVATHKLKCLQGFKLMILQPLDSEGKNAGSEILAVDGIGAGIGDLVIAIAEGGSARKVCKVGNITPIDTAIAGIVDVYESNYGKLQF